MTGIQNFTLKPQDIRFFGDDLSRPECVLVEKSGTLWISDNRGCVTRIEPGGHQTRLGAFPGWSNGLAMERSGTLLIANNEANFLHRLYADGRSETLFDTLDGEKLGSVNFVYRDPGADRLWIAIATRTYPRINAVKGRLGDGAILVAENGKLRIALDNVYFANEIRIDRARRHLYVAETAMGRIIRMPLSGDGQLGQREVFGPAELFPGAKIDGIAFDAEGNLWLTELDRNSIHVIDPDGQCRCVFEDPAGDILPGPSSLCFAGPDLKTVYVGSIKMKTLGVFQSPIAGEPLAHWNDR